MLGLLHISYGTPGFIYTFYLFFIFFVVAKKEAKKEALNFFFCLPGYPGVRRTRTA
jgi:hypothetical protein